MAIAVRSLIWLQSILIRAPDRSESGLNEEFLKYTKKFEHRVFAKIERNGIDPSKVRIRKTSLVNAVGANQTYATTLSLFNSPLWELLSVPRCNRQRLLVLFQRLTQLRTSLRFDLKRFQYKGSIPASYGVALTTLAEVDQLDNLAILVAYYLLLVDERSFEQAAVVKGFMLKASLKVTQDLGCNDATTALFMALIRDRVILGHWDSLITPDQYHRSAKLVGSLFKQAGRKTHAVPGLAVKAFALLATAREDMIDERLGPIELEDTVIDSTTNVSLRILKSDLQPSDPLFEELRVHFRC